MNALDESCKQTPLEQFHMAFELIEEHDLEVWLNVLISELRIRAMKTLTEPGEYAIVISIERLEDGTHP